MMNHAIILMTCVSMLSTDPPGTDQADAELARLQGPWMQVGCVIDGIPRFPEYPIGREYTEEPQLWIVGDRYYLRTIAYDTGITPIGSGRLTVDPSRNPKVIDMAPADPEHRHEVDRGIYLLNGKILLLCTGARRPATFDSKEGSGIALKMYLRESPDEPRPRLLPKPEIGKLEIEKLQGTWALTEEVVDGRLTPRKQIEGRQLRIKKDVYVLRAETPDGDSVQAFGTLVPHAEQSPRALSLRNDRPEIEPLEGIYRLEGDVLTLSLARERPTRFAAPAGSGATRRVYRRRKD